MAYRLKNKDGCVGDAVRRIANEQIGKALASIREMDRAEAMHDVRKRCKKLRGLVRLIRPAFDTYSDENSAFRDAARKMSGARDAKVMQDTYDLLMSEFADQVDRRALGPIRRHFTMQRKSQVDNGDVEQKLIETRECLLEARERASSWEISGDGWPAIESGLKKTYARARDAAAQARACPNGEIFHELRKRVKYHWYHCRLLENIWPDMMGMRKRVAARLSDILGDHHDLEVFSGELRANSSTFANRQDVEVAIGLAHARQARLEERAWPMLNRLFAEPPKALGEHFQVLWNEWWRHDS